MENDSKSFIFGYVFEFIVVASVPANQRLSYHCARFHFYGNRAICVEAFKSILIMNVYMYHFEIITLHSLLSKNILYFILITNDNPGIIISFVRITFDLLLKKYWNLFSPSFIPLSLNFNPLE